MVPDRPDPLDGWMADAKVDEAARSRSRRHSLQRQARESATLAGTLADLADAGSEVTVVTLAGSEHRGRVAALGRDVVALRKDGGSVVVAIRALSIVRAEPGAVATGDRDPASPRSMLGALENLRDEGEVVTLRLAGERAVTGRLEGVGVDVLSVRAGSAPGSIAYLPLDAVLEVEVAGSG